MSVDLRLPRRTHMLKNSHNNYVGFQSHGSSFLVGFTNKGLATHAAQQIRPSSRFFMKDVALTNVRNLMDNWYPNEMKGVPDIKVLIDSDARLVIQKQTWTDPPEEITRYVIPTDEFIMYPFTKNIGVVLADDLVSESPRRIIYNIHVIAPAFCPELFEPPSSSIS